MSKIWMSLTVLLCGVIATTATAQDLSETTSNQSPPTITNKEFFPRRDGERFDPMPTPPRIPRPTLPPGIPSPMPQPTLPPGVPSPIPAPAGDDSLTIATWNIQYLAVVGSDCCDHINNRIIKMAEGIRASNIDVIAFNEAFTDEAQEKLSDLLDDMYPYRVTYIDGDGEKTELDTAEEAREVMRTGVIKDDIEWFTDMQDSGLMIFSKYPFQLFPKADTDLVSEGDLKAIADGASWPHVAFDQFRICEGFVFDVSGASNDCLANKGVGLVRISKPGSSGENIYNIAFSHFEAGTDDPSLGALIRDLAIDIAPTAYVKSIFDRAIGDRPDEQYIVIGDLNINGASSTARPEWVAKFTASGRLFTDRFQDAWEEMRPTAVAIEDFDPGLSSDVFGTGQNRLDYIMVGNDDIAKWNGQTCVQHVRIPPNIYLDHEGEELSDHRPVVATLNRPAPHCSPQTAKVIATDDFAAGIPLTISNRETQIAYPKGAQWYLLSDPGSYSIAGWAESGSVQLEVYASDNMSVPLQPYRGETREIVFPVAGDTKVIQTANVIASPNKPLFIKVTMPDESKGGRYSLGIHKHIGGDKEDAIILFPGIEQTAQFSAAAPTSLDRWFRFDTDGALSGAPQTLDFSASTASAIPIASRLIKPDESVVETFDANTFQRQDPEDNFQAYYWVATPSRFQPNLALQVGWKTNLQVLVMQSRTGNTSTLTATNETGWGLFGSDDNVRMNLFADGVQLFSQPISCEGGDPGCVATTADDRPNFGDFDTDTVKQVDPKLTCSVGFLESLKVEISEEEGVRNNQVMTGIIADNLLLAPDEPERDAQAILLSSDAGEYRLKFYLQHSTQGKDQSIGRSGYKATFRGPVPPGERRPVCRQ